MNAQKFEFILFDTIGTTVKDTAGGRSLIIESFNKAFVLNGIQVAEEIINSQRGKSKKEAIGIILDEYNLLAVSGQKIYDDFMEILNSTLSQFNEVEGASEVFNALKKQNIKIGLGSGLPMKFIKTLFDNLDWNPNLFDYIGSSEELGNGRPNPIMLLDAITKLRLSDKTRILKVGDTITDIQEGINAGVVTAGVLTGTQKRETLEKYRPDYIFSDITGLLTLI